MEISVIIPVFNSEKYLSDSLESILNQTYTNFELIIINDGSTDGSEEIIQKFKDPRIKYIKFDINKGIVAALNYGVSIARGQYVFRMDSDDICYPDRLQKQLDFLHANPHLDLIGSRASFFVDNIRNTHVKSAFVPNSSSVIEFMLLLCSPFVHPTIVFKRQLLEKFNPFYADGFNYGDDYELFTRLSGHVTFGYHNDFVLHYRIHNSDTRLTGERNKSKYKSSTGLLRKRYFQKLGISIPEKLLDHYENVFYGTDSLNVRSALLTYVFFKQIKSSLSSFNFSQKDLIFLDTSINSSILSVYHRYSKIGLKGFLIYLKYIRKDFRMQFMREGKFLVKCFLKI